MLEPNRHPAFSALSTILNGLLYACLLRVRKVLLLPLLLLLPLSFATLLICNLAYSFAGCDEVLFISAILLCLRYPCHGCCIRCKTKQWLTRYPSEFFFAGRNFILFKPTRRSDTVLSCHGTAKLSISTTCKPECFRHVVFYQTAWACDCAHAHLNMQDHSCHMNTVPGIVRLHLPSCPAWPNWAERAGETESDSASATEPMLKPIRTEWTCA